MKTYSTREAAKMLGITMMTLHRHVVAKKITVPPVQHVGGSRFRAWKQSDVERVRKQLPRIKDGRKRRRK
jgi:predicted DNA-binding transcriptional regulator AlpA